MQVLDRGACRRLGKEQAEQLLALARVENLALGDQLLDDQALLGLLQRLGYRDIHALWLDWRRARPQAPVREFVDGMLQLGAVPVAAYRAALLR